MSGLWFALFLGALQGFTEFLPISSSGHLVLAQKLLPGFSQPGVLFDVTLHLGTLGAVCLYFWRDLWALARAPFAKPSQETTMNRRLLWLLILGSLPTAIIGLMFRKQFEAMFTDIQGVGFWFLVTGTLLFLSDRVKKEGRPLSAMRISDALLIGVAQGIAIIPALSRSGSTIATGIFLGLERIVLVQYSFLLSIPAILGAFVLETFTHRQEFLQAYSPLPYLVGALVALTIGYWSIAVLIHMTRSRRLSWFGYYCWGIGLLAFILSRAS